jgi:hypothetical protein
VVEALEIVQPLELVKRVVATEEQVEVLDGMQLTQAHSQAQAAAVVVVSLLLEMVMVVMVVRVLS